MSALIADLLQRQHDALARINEAIVAEDQRAMKAWRAAFKRINAELFAAGYQHKPVEKSE